MDGKQGGKWYLCMIGIEFTSYSRSPTYDEQWLHHSQTLKTFECTCKVAASAAIFAVVAILTAFGHLQME